MYSKYNRCGPRVAPQPSLSESERIAIQHCDTMYVTTLAGPDVTTSGVCNTDSQKIRVEVPFITSASIPYVPTSTTPASLTTQQRVENIKILESNPYDPATRFRKYFPPAPLPYICPERIPNNDTKPSTNPCLPIQRFRGSAAEAEESAS